MKLFSYFFCSAYNAYNTSGSKPESTLRYSAITLITVFQSLNIVSGVILISFLTRKFVFPSWVILIITLLIFIYNHLYFTKSRSSILLKNYLLLNEFERKRNKIYLLVYNIFSFILVVFIIVFSAYLKNQGISLK